MTDTRLTTAKPRGKPMPSSGDGRKPNRPKWGPGSQQDEDRMGRGGWPKPPGKNDKNREPHCSCSDQGRPPRRGCLIHGSPWRDLAPLARAVCSLAVEGGMSDTYWATDTRIAAARVVLGSDEVDEWMQGLHSWRPPSADPVDSSSSRDKRASEDRMGRGSLSPKCNRCKDRGYIPFPSRPGRETYHAYPCPLCNGDG